MTPSRAARDIAHRLTDPNNAVPPAEFPRDPLEAARPGMYAWWGDTEACEALGEEIGAPLSGLLYAGQTGATRKPSGRKSSATLASRVARQHIRGNARSSTFRLTISTLLFDRFSLVSAGKGRLDATSNAHVSAWIAEHLSVAIAPFDDRDSLGEVEEEVLELLDPPLNLGTCLPSAARARITERRRLLRR
jgi:GIY-YIG catalytic domain-containing protein